MFFKTVTISDLKARSGEILSDVQSDHVLQVVHRGSAIKVVMTQEHYLSLLERLAAFEKPSGRTVAHVSADELLQRVKDAVHEAVGDATAATRTAKREASNG